MVLKMYHTWDYNVTICINTPKILQNFLLDTFDLPDHSEGDQKLCKLFLDIFYGPKNSKKVSYVELLCHLSLINMVGPSQPTVQV